VLVPVLTFMGAMSVGVLASSRWLPDLAEGEVAGLAFFLVCGMLGAALGLVGLHAYELVEALGRSHAEAFLGNKGQLMAATLRNAVFESGSLVGLAAVVYLLAPPADEEDEPRAQPAASSEPLASD
jgi:uncharacterized membrane protein YuzA (DUF378 family)